MKKGKDEKAAAPPVLVEQGPELVPAQTKGREIKLKGWKEVQSLLPMIRFTRAGQQIEVEYLGTRSGVGPNKSNVHAFRAQGVECGIWGSTILDAKMSLLRPEPGTRLILYYDGEVETSRGLNPAKNIRVFVQE